MQGWKLMGSTGFDFGIGDELGTTSVMEADMHMWDGGFRYVHLIGLYSAGEVVCRIEIFRWRYCASPSAQQMMSAQLQMQTDQFSA